MSWFDDDPELLRAALEIIESWDGESSVNGVRVMPSPTTEETDSMNDDNDLEGGSEDGSEDKRSSTTAVSSPPSTVRTVNIKRRGGNGTDVAPRALKPSTVSSTRHKRREEIIYLRDKVTEMETQLATLQKQQINGDDSASSTMNGVDAALAVMWQDISGRQQRLRNKAELEQAKLRGLLETQMKVARGLIKLMQKARKIEEDESFPAAKRPKLPISASVGMSEQALSARLQQNYNEIDAAFTFPKFQDGTVKFIDVEVGDRDDDEVVIEFRDAWALPFEIDDVMDAMWTYMKKRTEQAGGCQDSVRSIVLVDEGTLATHWVASASIATLKGKFDGKGTTKRFPPSRERGPAIISTMCVEPHVAGADELEGIRVYEDAWLRVVSAKSLTEQTNDRVLAVVQSFRRFRLSFDVDKTPASRRNAGVLTDFLLDQLTQELQFKHETVETLLLHLRAG